MNKEKTLTRRDFLRDTSYGAAGITLGLSSIPEIIRDQSGNTSKVVLVRDSEAMDEEGNFNEPVIAGMLDEAVTTLFGIEDAHVCWQEILKPDDILGIKTNVINYFPTPSAVNQAIKNRALAVGIPEERISTRDRNLSWDSIFTSATALINARPLRSHHWSGIGGCIKNYITFHVRPSRWHDDSCADLGGLWKMPINAGKTRLNILVVLRPQFYGIGPHHYDTQYIWPYKGLLVSTDPVSVDAVGVKLFEEKRKVFFERPPRGGTSTKHVRLADTRHGIGVADLDRIELIKIGWMEDVLI